MSAAPRQVTACRAVSPLLLPQGHFLVAPWGRSVPNHNRRQQHHREILRD